MLALISWVPVATTGTQRLSNTFSMVSFMLKVFLGVCVCVSPQSVVLNWGQFCLSENIWQYRRHFRWSRVGGESCYRHATGKGWRCCWRSYNAQDRLRSPKRKIIQPQRSIVLRLRTPFWSECTLYEGGCSCICSPLYPRAQQSAWSTINTEWRNDWHK